VLGCAIFASGYEGHVRLDGVKIDVVMGSRDLEGLAISFGLVDALQGNSLVELNTRCSVSEDEHTEEHCHRCSRTTYTGSVSVDEAAKGGTAAVP
jgi:hypothetical protein